MSKLDDLEKIEWEDPADFEEGTLPDLPELITGLRKITRTKLKYGVTRVRKKKKLEKSTKALARVMAEFRAEAIVKKETLDLTSAEDRTQWVLMQDEVKKAEDKVADTRVDYEAAKLLEQYCEDEFVSLRKQANLLQEYNKDSLKANEYDDN